MDEYLRGILDRTSKEVVADLNKDAAFLDWLADRLVHVYGESPNVDFVLRLREISNLLKHPE
jgi:hypothetical protein